MSVGVLVERMRAGDLAATREVRRRLGEGDAEVVQEIGRRLAAGDGELAKRLVNVDDEDPDAFQAALLRAADLTTSEPATTGALLESLKARAGRLGVCQTVQVLGLDARRLTLLGDLARARQVLEKARTAATACRACDLDTLRREALLLLSLGEGENALAKSQAAMDGYETLEGQSHDVNGNGWASSLIARGEIRFGLGDKVGAGADFALALQHFPRTSKVWAVTQQNLASSLALSGPLERRQVHAELTALRLSMRRGETVERACFLWMDGQLVISAGEPRYLGLDRLRRALRLYRHPKISMPEPFFGVASDYARVLFPDKDKLVAFLDREVEPHLGFVKCARHRQQFEDLLALAKNRRRPASTWPSLHPLRRAIEELRECAADQMPCLLPPWPALP